MTIEFEWDPEKASANRAKHRVTFEEAATAFADPLSLAIPDPDHSDDEDRWILLGRSMLTRILVVVHVERGERVRIISARKANRREASVYAGLS
jgi:uncharacterized DUF497 family protein